MIRAVSSPELNKCTATASAEDRDAAFDLVAGVAERGEGFVLGVVHQEVAVGEVEYAGLSEFGVGVIVPACLLEERHDELSAGVGFGHRHGCWGAGEGWFGGTIGNTEDEVKASVQAGCTAGEALVANSCASVT